MRKLLPKISIAFLIILSFHSAGHAFKLPDTGQTLCYQTVSPYDEMSCNGTGQDGEYSINPMSFSGNVDSVTGVTWQSISEEPTRANWYRASGTYHKDNNPDTISVCGSLGMRLPTKRELISIVNYGTYNPAFSALFADVYMEYPYWSSTKSGYYYESAWIVYFEDGNADYDGYLENFPAGYVWCVSGGEEVIPSFTDNNNGTITDNNTGLMWQKCSRGQNNNDSCTGSASYSVWGDALAYCNNLVLPLTSGYDDWRLPNIKELESLTDDAFYTPVIDPAYFPATPVDTYWSSTTYALYPYSAWGVAFRYGNVNDFDKGGSGYVRCVRGGVCANQPVKIGNAAAAYEQIQEAYAAAGPTETIRSRAVSLGENLTFANGKMITLIGGYDCDFKTNGDFTTIARLTIGGTDKVTISKMVIK
jgi:hypothetical protein